MKKEKICVVSIDIPNTFKVKTLEAYEDINGDPNRSRFDEFIINAGGRLFRHGFDIFEEHWSDNADSLSYYITAFKGEDFENSYIKVVLHIRLSDHDINPRTEMARNRYYTIVSNECKMPIDKEYQDWEFINIVTYGHERKDYRVALEDLDSALEQVEQQYYELDEDYDNNEQYSIEYWYDRYTRSWVTQVFDSNHYEVDCSYTGNKEDRDYEIERFKNEYNTDKVMKWRG